MKKIKILYTEDGKLLWSKFFPEVPPIKASIYADEVAMNDFNTKMKDAVKSAIPILNPQKAFEKIAFKEPVERYRIYEIECDYIVRTTIEIL